MGETTSSDVSSREVSLEITLEMSFWYQIKELTPVNATLSIAELWVHVLKITSVIIIMLMQILF